MRLINILFSLSFCMSLFSAHEELIVDLVQSKNAALEKLEDFWPKPQVVSQLRFKSDNQLSRAEFIYLADIKLGTPLKRAQLEQVMKYLFDKDQLISIHFKKAQAKKGVRLEVNIKGDWVVGDIVFRGVSLGSSKYLQYYDLQVGERFSQEKHEASLEKLITAFHQKGYKNFTCDHHFFHNEKHKKVSITLHCKKGKCFSCGFVQVHVEAPEGIPTRELQEKLQAQLTDALTSHRYNQELISEHTKQLQDTLMQEGFAKSTIKLQEQVAAKTHKVNFVFTVQLGNKRNFTFFGNHFFSDASLSSMITKFGFSVDMLPASLLAQDITAAYYDKGFWNVTVDEVAQDDGSIYFVIKEGERSGVKKVTLKGIEKGNTRSLAGQFFKRFTTARFFDAQLLKQSIEKLLNFYKKRGFWDVKVLQKQYEPIKNSNNFQLLITLEEGQQRFLKKVAFDKPYTMLAQKSPFLAINTARRPTPFDKHFLKEQFDWIIEYFRKQGYFLVKAEPTLVQDGADVTVTWKVDPGEKITVGKVLFKGASEVSHNTLQSMLALKPGKVWTKSRMQLGAMRLKQLDVFKQIRIHPVPGVNKDQRNLVVYLEDDQPFEIRTRLGFQQVSKNFALKKGSTYKVGGSWLWRNPTHHADLLRFDGDVTRFEQRLEGSYSIPCTLPLPVVATVKGYGNKYTQPLAAGSHKTLYKVTQEGVLGSLRSQTRHTSTAVTAGFEWIETKDISHELADAINFKADLISKKIPYFFIEPSLFVDLLDNKVNPTKGIFVAASLKGMFPLRSSSYSVKLLVEKGIFFPLIKHHAIICAARVRFGHIFKETFSKIMPPERFYLGGANSIRGYLPDSCPPLGSFTDDKGALQRVPQGGKSMVNMNLEMRIPLTQQVDCVLFQDFGMLVEDIESLSNGNNNLAASGFGLRYNTSIGPLRFDIGWKWKKPFPEDAGYAWFLTFGHAF